MMDIEWTHLRQTLEEFADAFIELARGNLDRNGTNASYDLYNSIDKIVEIGEDRYSVKISLEDYWTYVENGRGPGKFPPPGVIEKWIEMKPVSLHPLSNGKTPSVSQAAFLIGRKIATEGTEAQPFFEPAKEEALRRFEKRIDEAIIQDVDSWIVQIVEDGMRNALG